MTGPHPTELEDELRATLRRLADESCLSPGADIGRAVARGRRTVRNRRALGVVAPLAAAALVASGVAATLPDGEEQRVLSRSVSPHRWDAPVSFGWLPWESTMTLQRFGGDPGQDYFVTIRSTDPEGEILNLQFSRVTQEERERSSRFQILPQLSPTKPVQGRKAFWGESRLRKGRLEGGTLTFEYEKDRWVRVSLGRIRGKRTAEELSEVVHRIAENLRFSPRPVPLPFRLAGMPTQLSWEGAQVVWHDVPDRRRVTLTFSNGLLIKLKPAGDADLKAPNTTVKGHPAYRFTGTETYWKPYDRKAAKPENAEQIRERRSRLVGSETLCVYNVRTFDVCMYTEAQLPEDIEQEVKDIRPAPDWASEVLRPSGGLVGLFERMTLIEGPASSWSTKPFPE